VASNSPTSSQSDLPKPPMDLDRPAPSSRLSARLSSSPFDAAAPTGNSLIGSDLTILGDKITIISQNKLQVDGKVRGDVHGKEILISKGGSVTGKVWAERIAVRGAVRGSIVAVSIMLHDSAKVEGDIMHQKISISEGAEFDGRARLIRDVNELIPILDAEVIARGKGNDEAHHYGT
jgi:cytoskeletal protein CcmA (bactofilin family)